MVLYSNSQEAPSNRGFSFKYTKEVTMIPIQEFLNVYDGKLRVGISDEYACTYTFNNGHVHYTDYNEKLQIKLYKTVELEDGTNSRSHSIIYDPGMDWVVYHREGIYGLEPEFRKHFKQVSKGENKTITPEVLRQILLIREDVLMDRYFHAMRMHGKI